MDKAKIMDLICEVDGAVANLMVVFLSRDDLSEQELRAIESLKLINQKLQAFYFLLNDM